MQSRGTRSGEEARRPPSPAGVAPPPSGPGRRNVSRGWARRPGAAGVEGRNPLPLLGAGEATSPPPRPRPDRARRLEEAASCTGPIPREGETRLANGSGAASDGGGGGGPSGGGASGATAIGPALATPAESMCTGATPPSLPRGASTAARSGARSSPSSSPTGGPPAECPESQREPVGPGPRPPPGPALQAPQSGLSPRQRERG
eukprot:15460373-Alexandrium_andersonii.AAC.1